MKIKNFKKTERRVQAVYDVEDLLCVMEKHGERPLFTYFEDREEKTLNYREFTHQVRATAAGLAAMGLHEGRVAVIGETSPAWLCSYLAILSCGGVAIPMDKELSVEEIAGFLAVAEADAIVFSATFKESFAILEERKCPRILIPMTETGIAFESDKAHPLPAITAIGEGKLAEGYLPPKPDRTKMSEMLFTSGTTGTSKCVMLSQTNIFSVVTSAVMSVPFYPEDRVVSVLPVHHTYELAIELAEMDYGLHVCINDSLRHAMRNFKKFQPTALVLVPLFVNTMYKKILSEAAKKNMTKKMRFGIRLSRILRTVGIDVRAKLFRDVREAFGGRLERIICGGAPLNPDLIYAFEDFGISIFEGCGITECAPLTAVTPYYKRKPGSVGPTVPCCTARIAGDSTNDKGYKEGEIQIKGDNVMLGYYNNPEANAAAFTADGWFRTGDMGYMDQDGYLTITGRLKSVIVLENGKNVYPEEIEEYIAKIEGVLESVVVGRTEEDGTVNLCAIIVPDGESFPEGTALADMEAKILAGVEDINRHAPTFKQIRKVEFRTEPFEKTTSKKIKRHLVK